jgi:hypothetical protein
MKNIVLIIPHIFKMLLIFDYKPCQAPNYTTKNSKRVQVERERLLCGVLEESTLAMLI